MNSLKLNIVLLIAISVFYSCGTSSDSKEKTLKEYEQLIKNIHTQLDDKSSEYIILNGSFLLKKVDFVNVRVIMTDI